MDEAGGADAGRRPWAKRLLAGGFLLGVTGLIQIVSQPAGPRFWWGLGLFISRIWPLLGSLGVLLAVWIALWALTHRMRLSAALLLVFWLPVALINSAKLSSLDLPLLPLDVYRAGDVWAVFHGGLFRIGSWAKCGMMIALAAMMAPAFLRLPVARRPWKTRLVSGSAAVVFLASLFLPVTNVFARLPDSFDKCSWDDRATYERNGFVVFLAMHCRYVPVEAPRGYSEEAVRRIERDLPPANVAISDLRPNVIVILSESFADVTRFPGVEFESDPVPTLHELQRDFGRVDLVSPVFGGGTCNAELEFLTGFNMRFFPPGTSAWIDSLRRPVPSLASILRERGYRAIALHAVGGLHNDAQVQPLLGFERCIPGSEWTYGRRIDHWRVSDESVTSEIVQWSRDLPRPWFLCVNTIEGHEPYDRDKYGGASGGIRFTRPFSERSREALTAYSYGLRNADRALRVLIDAFRDAKEPTLIVFYGDHLPKLGEELEGYREMGLCAESGSFTVPMRTVPAVIWNNFGKRLPAAEGPVGMCRMLPAILDLMEIPKPPHVRVVEKACVRRPVISTAGCFEVRGRELTPDEEAADPDLADYRMMQYDLLFGRRYFRRE